MVFLYALNRKLYDELPMSLNSLLINNPKAKVYVMCEDDEISFIKDPRVTFLNINNYPKFEINPKYEEYILSNMTFVRLWIANYLKESRIIYLDVDTIIDGPLDELWNTNLGPKVIGAVFDAYTKILSKDSLYINAGVLLMDLDKWRAGNFTEKTQKILQENYFRYADQDALNTVLKSYIKYLDLKWNFQLNQPGQVKIKNPVIFHYAAHPKIFETYHGAHAIKYYTKEIKNYEEKS